MTQPLDLTRRPTRHSYSSLKRYMECPYSYACLYILGLPYPASAAMDRGTRLHKLAEDYLNGELTSCPFDIKLLGMRIYRMKGYGAKAEETWMLDADWNPTQDIDAAKIKAIIDVHYEDNGVLKIHDYKSGRVYPEHESQLEFYALIGLRRFPDAKRVEASALYFDTGDEGRTRSLLPAMYDHYHMRWADIITRLESDGGFEPTAGAHCRRCPYGMSKGGPCTAEQR